MANNTGYTHIYNSQGQRANVQLLKDTGGNRPHSTSVTIDPTKTIPWDSQYDAMSWTISPNNHSNLPIERMSGNGTYNI